MMAKPRMMANNTMMEMPMLMGTSNTRKRARIIMTKIKIWTNLRIKIKVAYSSSIIPFLGFL